MAKNDDLSYLSMIGNDVSCSDSARSDLGMDVHNIKTNHALTVDHCQHHGLIWIN